MQWRIGVLRSGVENVDWTAGGEEPCWSSARRRAVDELYALAVGEGRRQEYRMYVGDVAVMLWPGLDEEGRLDLTGIDDALPVDRNEPLRW